MGEVSTNAFALLLDALEARGLSAADVLEGSGLTVEALRRPNGQVPWADYARFMHRYEALVGGHEALWDIGRRVSDDGWVLAATMRVFGLFTSPHHGYWALDAFLGNVLFPSIESSYSRSGDRVELVLRIPDDADDCPSFFHVCGGAFEVLPTYAGYDRSRVSLELDPRVGRYTIELPGRRHGGVWRRTREKLGAVAGVRALVEALSEQQAEIRRHLARQRRIQRTLEASEARWRALVENVPDVVFALDPDGRVTFLNRERYGMTREQVVGRRVFDLLHPHRAATFRSWLATVREERRAVVRTGSWSSLHEGERELSFHLGPVLRGDQLDQVIVVARDVTELRREERERRALDQRMLHTQKLESLGLLAGSIAHDFNNLLMGIQGNAELALLSLDEGPARIQVERVVQTTARAAELTHQMLAYAGRATFEVEAVDLSGLVEGMADLMIASLPKTATLERRLEPDLPPVAADGGQLSQVVLNLLTNASEALGGAPGRIRVETRRAELSEGEARDAALRADIPAGVWVVLEVADDGMGIDEPTRRRIFEPFFTTRARGRGLGLASVLGIVRGHGGRIRVDSAPGRGTRFQVLLRPAELAPEADAEAPRVVEGRLDGAAVLVVDDEAVVRQAARDLLERHGVVVETAGDGVEAVEAFSSGRFDAVLLDLTMPRMGGAEAWDRMQALRPDVPVLLTSGYDGERVATRLLDRGVAAFLRKPYAAEELLAALRRSLGR